MLFIYASSQYYNSNTWGGKYRLSVKNPHKNKAKNASGGLNDNIRHHL